MPVVPRDPRPLEAIPTRDLKLGISALQWQVPGIDDLALLRSELMAREAVAA